MLASLLLVGTLFGSATVRGPLAVPPRDSVDLPAIAALIDRVLPGRARAFTLEVIPDSAGLDVFEVEQPGARSCCAAPRVLRSPRHSTGISSRWPASPCPFRSARLRCACPPVPARVRHDHPYQLPLLLQLLHLLLQHGLVGLGRLAADDRLDGAQGDQHAPRGHRPGGDLAGWSAATSASATSRSASSWSARRTCRGAGWGTSTASAGRCRRAGSTSHIDAASGRSSPASARSA